MWGDKRNKKSEQDPPPVPHSHGRPVVAPNQYLTREINSEENKLIISPLPADDDKSKEVQIWLIWKEPDPNHPTTTKTHRHLIHDYFVARPQAKGVKIEKGKTKFTMSEDRMREYLEWTAFPQKIENLVFVHKKNQDDFFHDAYYQQYDIKNSNAPNILGHFYMRMKYNDPGIYVITETETFQEVWNRNAQKQTILRYGLPNMYNSIEDQDIHEILRPIDNGWETLSSTMECKGNVLFLQSLMKYDNLLRMERKACWPVQDPEKLCTSSLVIYNLFPETILKQQAHQMDAFQTKISGIQNLLFTSPDAYNTAVRNKNDNTRFLYLDLFNRPKKEVFDAMNEYTRGEIYDVFCMKGVLISRWLDEKERDLENSSQDQHANDGPENSSQQIEEFPHIRKDVEKMIENMGIIKMYPPMKERITLSLELKTPLNTVLGIMSEINMHYFTAKAQNDKRTTNKYSLYDFRKEREYTSLASHLEENPFTCKEYQRDVDVNAHAWVEALGVGKVCRTEAGALSSIMPYKHFFERRAV